MLSITSSLIDLHKHEVPRVGQVTARKLATEVAVLAGAEPDKVTVEDLLRYLPMRYEDRSQLGRIADLAEGRTASLEVVVRGGRIIPFKGGRIRLYEFLATDTENEIRAFWWNQIFLSKVFHAGTRVILYGKWQWNRHRSMFEVENPEFEVLDDDDDAVTAPIHTSRRVPIYRKLGDLRTRQLRGVLYHVLERVETIPEVLPDATVRRQALISRDDALRFVHFPDDSESIDSFNNAVSRPHRRLIFEEFLFLTMALDLRRGERKREPKGAKIAINNEIREKLTQILPFDLTGAQTRVVAEIFDDLTGNQPMNRLLQGDVGSGKTIVALMAMVLAVENGYQAALMAPTEILAEQHARNVTKLLHSTLATPISVGLLTGSLRAKQKREMQESIAEGSVDIVIGTHALIQEAVEFKRLALAVVDEQHRFGVVQRAGLRRRGMNPDVLVMTATPIPRSLAMTLYGDLDVSVIDELPPGRTPVATFVRGEDRREKSMTSFGRRSTKDGRPILSIRSSKNQKNSTSGMQQRCTISSAELFSAI